ncbi:MAG: FecR domain-containing protein [Flavobacterium sp.]|nr:FecR domain-containing protein [Flavobacterium sp.]
MKKDYKKLLQGYVNNTLTPKELQAFIDLTKQERYADELSSAIHASLEGSVEATSYSNGAKERIFNTIVQQSYEENSKKPVRKIPVFWKYAVAASFIGLLFATFHFSNTTSTQKNNAFADNKKITENKFSGSDTFNQTILTLADGSNVVLEGADDGELAQQGGTKIIKLKRNLLYKNGEHPELESGFNFLTTTKGSQYQVELEDGTKVWLNASSSLKFPTAFTGYERIVELTGEAYFEVAKNPDVPFKVKVKNSEIEVLGTHFNVNAYDNENAINATLLEGSVKVVHAGEQKIIKPSQQAQIKNNGEFNVKANVSTNEIVAWTNGVFQFKNTPVSAIFREVERWYDVDFVNTPPPNTRFTGVINRSVSIEEFLKFLEATQTIHFKKEGKKITVL